MKNENAYYALAMDEYSGEESSLSCYNTTDYLPMEKCFGIISIYHDYVCIYDIGFKDIAEMNGAYPEIMLSNKYQFLKKSIKPRGTKQYYVFCIDSNERFNHGGINAEADGDDVMFCVLEIYDNCAEILDWGYSSLDQLLDAWRINEFQNVGTRKQWNLKNDIE